MVNILSNAAAEAYPPLFPGFQPMPSLPAFFNERRQAWLVFRYPEVRRVLSDYTIFSNNRGGLDPSMTEAKIKERVQQGELKLETATPVRTANQANIIAMDPPLHRKYRALVSSAFTPRTITQLEPRITSIVHELLDRVIERGEMDVIDDFSYPLSITVIAELLGVPASDQQQFKTWTEAFFEITSQAALNATRELAEYLSVIVAQRRSEPRDDLISALIAARVDGESLTDADIVGTCSLVLLAGNDTTRNLIGNAILCFDKYPESAELLRGQPELLPDAIEEVLRFLPSVHTAPRLCIADTLIDGQEVKAGQWVLPMLASANRDEEQFPDAQAFDVTRHPNRHLTFGHGVHFCLGAPLARAESRIALQAMFERLQDIKRVQSIPLEPLVSPIVYVVKHVPITFSRA